MANAFLTVIGKLPTIIHMVGIALTADTNQDGTVDGNETARAIARSLPDVKALFPHLIEMKGQLATAEGQAAFAEELVALLDKYEAA